MSDGWGYWGEPLTPEAEAEYEGLLGGEWTPPPAPTAPSGWESWATKWFGKGQPLFKEGWFTKPWVEGLFAKPWWKKPGAEEVPEEEEATVTKEIVEGLYLYSDGTYRDIWGITVANTPEGAKAWYEGTKMPLTEDISAIDKLRYDLDVRKFEESLKKSEQEWKAAQEQEAYKREQEKKAREREAQRWAGGQGMSEYERAQLGWEREQAGQLSAWQKAQIEQEERRRRAQELARPENWIERWMYENMPTQGAPPAPPWLPKFVPSMKAGQPITKQPALTLSGQQAQQISPEQWQGLRGYINWAGVPGQAASLEDYVARMEAMYPGAQARQPRWGRR